jgi:hypothetical protein
LDYSLIPGLFDDAFRVFTEECNRRDVEGCGRGLVSEHFLEDLSKTTEQPIRITISGRGFDLVATFYDITVIVIAVNTALYLEELK